jgi:1-deoxy-D-xylulose-5-phosphate synthase
MLDFALSCDGPASLRYPKTGVETVERERAPIELGKSEVIDWGQDGMIVVCGTQLCAAMAAAETLRAEGFDVGVINARFIKPLDRATILKAVRECSFVVTVEEAALAGGFGSAVLEACADEHLSTESVHRLGVPDRFIEHGTRGELLADLELDADGIAAACRKMAAKTGVQVSGSRVVG